EAGGAVVSNGALERCRRLEKGRPKAGLGVYRTGQPRWSPRGPRRCETRVRRAAYRAPLVAASLRTANRSGVPEAGGSNRQVAGNTRAPRPRREQIPRLAENRPHGRFAVDDSVNSSATELRRHGMGE